MTSFPLPDLHPVLLERVITKIHWKSYTRLQRTCSGAVEFIRKSRNIRVHIGHDHALQFNRSSCNFTHHKNIQHVVKKPIGLEALYGTRLAIAFKSETLVNFDRLYEYLKRNRITCSSLFLFGSDFTWGQCVALFNILKPADVHLNSEHSLRFEALFHLKSVSSVNVRLDQHVLASEVAKLLSRFPKVTISLLCCTDLFYSIRVILRVLRSRPFPNLRYFDFYACGGVIMPTKDEFAEQLRDFNLTMEKQNKSQEISALVGLPKYLPDGYSCKVTMTQLHTTGTNIHYGMDWAALLRSTIARRR